MNSVCREASRWVLCIALGGCFEGFWSRSLAKTVPGAQEPSRSSLTVRIHNYAKVKPSILRSAEDIARQVFSTIGIRVTWLDVSLTHAELANFVGSLLDPGKAVVDVSILPRSMTALAKLPESTLGSTPTTHEGDRATVACVYYDHIELEVRNTHASKAQILGYAIAHELGHMLLRTSQHASEGIMIAKWRPVELQRAAQGLLVFTPQQADYIRTEVAARHKISEPVAPKIAVWIYNYAHVPEPTLAEAQNDVAHILATTGTSVRRLAPEDVRRIVDVFHAAIPSSWKRFDIALRSVW